MCPGLVETVYSNNEALTIWDVGGGCSRIPQRILNHYCGTWSLIVFVVDASDLSRSHEAIDELWTLVGFIEARYLAVVFNKLDKPVENKQGFEKLVSGIKKVLKHAQGYECEVYDDLDQFSAKTGAQTDILLERLIRAAKTGKKQMPDSQVRKQLDNALLKRPSKEELLEKIEEGAKNPNQQLPPGDFLKRMISGDLETWDHQSHLRAGFLCLAGCQLKESVVFEAAELFLGWLDAMLKAKPGKFRNTRHRTMTIFWLHRIYFAMLTFRQANGSFPQREKFKEFLVEYPDLMDGKSWMPHYTKDHLFGSSARENWRLPDLEPLPQFIAQSKKEHTKETTDDANNTADLLRRSAYIILKTAWSTNQRRATVINEMFPAIEKRIMRLRAQSPCSVEPFSQTQAYFWVQMVHAAVQSLPPDSGLDITRLTFESFMVLFPELLASNDAWKEYYTPEQWYSIDARMNTVLPKIKPLPNILQSPEQTRVDKAIGVALDEKLSQDDPSTFDGRPSTEELFLRVRFIVKDTAELSPNDSNPPETHAELLRRIFNRLIEIDPETRGTGASLASAAWAAVSALVEEREITSATFWSQMVLGAFCSMDSSFQAQASRFRAKEIGVEKDKARNELFSQFLTASPELCWDRLWRIYYSDEVWKSQDAKDMQMLPDRRAIPAYIAKRGDHV
ncbi:hypothetical protein FQN54_009986 [Arachnomyces sp. PD_36]|nr:hypothetical protein FQN54_009986 [Arachnomyces sp. PD_36]